MSDTVPLYLTLRRALMEAEEKGYGMGLQNPQFDDLYNTGSLIEEAIAALKLTPLDAYIWKRKEYEARKGIKNHLSVDMKIFCKVHGWNYEELEALYKVNNEL